MASGVAGPRERYRAQVQAEVKERAWEQIAASGVAALSLKAIAQQMGLSGPALYRYFAGRDELITELIRDAYRSLADTVRQAREEGAGVAGLANVIRRWALADPHRYFLIYGTPVPGYHAPEDTTAVTREIMAVLLEAYGSDENSDGRALRFWTRVHGVLSLELAGHFTGMDLEPQQLFDAEVESLL